MFPNDRASLSGIQTKSSLQMGAISTEYVNLKLAVLVCVSIEISCSDDFILHKSHASASRAINGKTHSTHFVGTTPAKNSVILIA